MFYKPYSYSLYFNQLHLNSLKTPLPYFQQRPGPETITDGPTRSKSDNVHSYLKNSLIVSKRLVAYKSQTHITPY